MCEVVGVDGKRAQKFGMYLSTKDKLHAFLILFSLFFFSCGLFCHHML
jgi:hypothetical protein